jgi:hypothetical protein
MGRVIGVFEGDDQVAGGEFEAEFDGFGEAGADVGPRDEAVDDNFDVVPHLAIQRQLIAQQHDAAVDARPDEALLLQVDEKVFELALLPADDRGEDREFRLRRQRLDAGDNRLARLGRNHLPALGAVALTDPSVEDAEEIVDLGDRANRRPRVVAGGFLRDGDRRAQSADVVDIGLGHLAQELPGEGREALDVATLALGEDRIERQRTFAAAGHPSEANELVAGEGDVDRAQVVLAGAFDNDVGGGHTGAAVGWRL